MNPFADGRLCLIAGPCVVEGRDVCMRIAKRLRDIAATRPVNLIFKASYDKANRTSIDSFRGIGFEEGLAVLTAVRSELGLPVITDVHEASQVARVAEVVDALQVPALLSRQTDLVVACGRTGKPVFLKKGQFLAPGDMVHQLRKVQAQDGHGPVALVERGTIFGYGNLVVDFRSLPEMRAHAPVVFDATHSVQRPGGLGHASDGDASLVPVLARAAAAVGIDGLFLETHEDPAAAKCDGPNMVSLDDLPALLDSVLALRAAAS